MSRPARATPIDIDALKRERPLVDVIASYGIELRREGKIARTVVHDSGTGIAPEMMPRIFEPYAQAPDSSAEMGSAGLGLYIAKEIVEAHNGRIFAESSPGDGTTFTIDIPIREELLGQDSGR